MHQLDTPSDQAAGLRRLFAPQLAEYVPITARRAETAALVANLGLACARIGRHVLIVDQTPGEIAQALGLAARFELAHVLRGDRALEQVILDAGDGIKVLPATRGLQQAAEHGVGLPHIVDRIVPRRDLVLVHAEPGALAAAPMPNSGEVLLPIVASSSGLTSAYIDVKRSAQRGERVRALVHGIATPDAARAFFTGLANLVRRFLAADIAYAGFVPADPALYKAVAARCSVFDIDPDSAAARALELVAGALGERRPLVH
jgi:flagellar biosynthesis protein FlhG